MHEVSIVAALLDQVRTEWQAYPTARVTRVRLRVGALRQAIPEMLTFSYDASVKGTDLEGSRLDIEFLPAQARCRRCQRTFAVAERWFECPGCGAVDAEVLSGEELQLASIEFTPADSNSGTGVSPVHSDRVNGRDARSTLEAWMKDGVEAVPRGVRAKKRPTKR